MIHVTPVIHCGGSGTQLWPLSRSGFPKLFLSSTGNESLFQQAAQRLVALGADDIQAAKALIVTGEERRFLPAEQLREAGIELGAALLEPVGRNTVPALTFAALADRAHGENPVLVVTPADQTVADTPAFIQAMQQAVRNAESGSIVILDITPDRPETGYGCIQAQAQSDAGVMTVQSFVEKPDAETAQQYLNDGGYANESIDYAVMERCPGSVFPIKMVPLDAGWSDLGAGDAVWNVPPKGEQGNARLGDVLNTYSRNTLAHTSGRLVSLVGVEDRIVIETPDTVLVADKSRSQDVKHVVTQLQTTKREEHTLHRNAQRPWDWYDSIDEGVRFKVKRIQVKPKASLSLQKHHHRAEHWIVVTGTDEITNEDKVLTLTENLSIYIPLGEVHRLSNPGTISLEIIEVQSGGYLGEDDIVQFEDTYGRFKS